MIEQLHYTWAKDGLQGHGQYQVTAASPGLRNLNGVLAKSALKLCRRPSSGTGNDLSFGWIDNQEYRFVFLRKPTGMAPDGSPGNFLAHILVAPIHELSSLQILKPSSGGLWWDGQPQISTELEVLNAQNLGIEYECGNMENVEQLIAKLLDNRLSGKFQYSWAEILAAMNRISLYMPLQMEQLRGFSTHEQDPRMISYFPIVGCDRMDYPGSNTGSSLAARSIAKQFIVDDPLTARSIKLIASELKSGADVTWRKFLVETLAYIEFKDDRTTNIDHVLLVLSFPELVSDVFSNPKGLSVIANSIVDGNQRVMEVIGRVSNSIEPKSFHSLGLKVAEIAQRKGRLSLVLSGLDHFSTRLPRQFFKGMAVPMLESLDLKALQYWPVPLLSEVINRISIDAPGLENVLNHSAIDRAIRFLLSSREWDERQIVDIVLGRVVLNPKRSDILELLCSTYPSLKGPLLLGSIRMNILPTILLAIGERISEDDFLYVCKSADSDTLALILKCIKSELGSDKVLKKLDEVLMLDRSTGNSLLREFYDRGIHKYLESLCKSESTALRSGVFSSFTKSSSAAPWRTFMSICTSLSINPSMRDLTSLKELLTNPRLQLSIAPLEYSVQNALQGASDAAQLKRVVETLIGGINLELITWSKRVAIRQLNTRNRKGLAFLVLDLALASARIEKVFLSSLRELVPFVSEEQWNLLKRRAVQEGKRYKRNMIRLQS